MTEEDLEVLRAHPQVDEVRDAVVLSGIGEGLQGLTAWRAELLLAARRSGRRPVLLGPADGALTEALRGALRDAGGTWVVEDGGSRWDGLTGAEVRDLDGAGSSEQGAEAVAPFLRGAVPEVLQLVVTASVRHRTGREGAVGRLPVALGRALGGSAPDRWGLHEPLERDWDHEEASALLLRAPRALRVLLGADGSPPMTGSLVAHPTRFGREEVVEAVFAVGEVGAEASESAAAAVSEALTRTAEAELPLAALAFVRPGRADLAIGPVLQFAPAPLAVLIGPPGVRDLDLDLGVLQRRFGAVPVGRPRIPGVLVPFSGRPDAWRTLSAFVDHVGSDRIAAAFGRATPTGARPEARSAAPNRHHGAGNP